VGIKTVKTPKLQTANGEAFVKDRKKGHAFAEQDQAI